MPIVTLPLPLDYGLGDENWVLWEQLSNLDSADDLALLSYSQQQMQKKKEKKKKEASNVAENSKSLDPSVKEREA